MNGSVAGGRQSVGQSIDSVQLKKVTEDMVIQKINKIFDDVQGDNNEFEESYTGLKKNTSRVDKSLSNDISSDNLAGLQQPKSASKKVTILDQEEPRMQAPVSY
mgnify:CR=1 FL=1